jgi:predicted RNA binding protein YcfA (HicA-like mRNA interferase family)
VLRFRVRRSVSQFFQDFSGSTLAAQAVSRSYALRRDVSRPPRLDPTQAGIGAGWRVGTAERRKQSEGAKGNAFSRLSSLRPFVSICSWKPIWSMITYMAKRDKLLQRMRNNPGNVSMRELQAILESFGFVLDRIAGSHYVFVGEIGGRGVTFVIPMRKPHIKAGYIRDVLSLVDRIKIVTEEEDDGEKDA